MSADADLIAEAVKTAFAAGYAADPRRVSQDIDVSRVHVLDVGNLKALVDWDHANPAAKAIKVYVRANIEKPSLQVRGKRMVFYTVQVAIAAKPKTTTNADVDALKLVAQELRDWFYIDGRTLPGRQEAISGDPDILLDADSESLRQSRLFLSEFVLQFQGMRTR